MITRAETATLEEIRGLLHELECDLAELKTRLAAYRAVTRDVESPRTAAAAA